FVRQTLAAVQTFVSCKLFDLGNYVILNFRVKSYGVDLTGNLFGNPTPISFFVFVAPDVYVSVFSFLRVKNIDKFRERIKAKPKSSNYYFFFLVLTACRF